MRSRAKAGVSVPRTGDPRPREAGASPIFLGGKASQGVGAGPQKSGDALRLPETLTEQLCPGESALSSLKGCSVAPLDPGAAQRGSDGSSAERWLCGGAQIQQRRPGSTGHQGHSPGSDLHPGQAEARKAQDSKDTPAQAKQISGPAPGASRPLQMESSVDTAGAESRAPELAASTGIVPPGDSRGKQPPLSPAPGRGTAAPPTANT